MLDADWRARETVLDLPLAHVPAPGEPRFVPDYFEAQPMARVGVAVDAGLRPVGPTARACTSGCSWPARPSEAQSLEGALR